MNGPKKKRVAVVGSGFGGSVTACRLAESGRFDVHVLERGARYGRNGFLRRTDDLPLAFWQPDAGTFGPIEYRAFTRSHIDVVTASALGGGSIIYSNVLYRMPARFLRSWPGGIRRETLDPFYDRAIAMLEAVPFPVDRPDWPYLRGTPKSRALAEAAAKIAASPRGHPKVSLEWPPLAIQFGPEPGREVINAQGVPQTTCVMCGECNIGCNTQSKNTLDLNYLARAARFGAVLRTSTAVRKITPRAGGGFDLLVFDPRFEMAENSAHAETFDVVILAAGSLGSTELVLGMRDAATLSPCVGTRWSPNGDLLGFVNDAEHPLDPSSGPVITGALHVHSASYPDGFEAGAWIEDGGLPGFISWYLLGRTAGLRGAFSTMRGLGDYLVHLLRFPARPANVGEDLRAFFFADRKWTTRSLLMLGMGRDRATGTLDLSEVDGGVHLTWTPGEGELHYQRARAMMSRVADALGGEFVENPLDDVLARYVSVHPVGGLPLGDDAKTGAVDAKTGRLFGGGDLYVVDGSVIPEAVGPNPALTIAALAEMFAERMIHG